MTRSVSFHSVGGTTVRRLAAAALTIILSGAFAAAASATPDSEGTAGTPATLAPKVEAWYYNDPTCGLPVGCAGAAAALTPPNPYPANTLHVFVAGGRELSRAFIGFDHAQLASSWASGTLDLPLDTAAADGSNSPDTAELVACPWSGEIQPIDGSLAPPPVPNCSRPVPLTYSASPSPHFEADITPILSTLTTSSGLAILPDPYRVANTDVWHVVFSAHDRSDSAKTPPATVTLQPGSPQTPVDLPPVPPSQDQPSTAPLPPLQAGTPPLSPITPGTAPSLAPPTVDQPTVVGAAPAALQTVRRFVPYAYPEMLLLPWLFLIVLPWAGRILTRDHTSLASRTSLTRSSYPARKETE